MRKILSIIIIGLFIGCSLGVQGVFFEKISDDCGCDKDMISTLSPYLFDNSLIPEEELISSTSLYNKYPFSTIISEDDLPSYFNWKDRKGKDFTTPAKDQGNCGSCWDFAAIGTLESIIKIRENNTNINPDLSEQYVLSCLPAAANHFAKGCNGGQPVNAFKCILSKEAGGNFCNGIIREECFPYQASHNIDCSEKCEKWEDYLVPISNYGSFNNMGVLQNTEESRTLIKNALYQHGAVSAYMDVTLSFILWGNINHDSEDYHPYVERMFNNRLNHGIIIVGWKNDPSIGKGGYWICKNSWGENWGYDGFYNIEYGTHFTGVIIDWVDYNKTDFYWPPLAKFGDFYSANVNEPILFDASESTCSEDGTIESYHWDFGDGNNGSGKTITHLYDQGGFYQVQLSVCDSNNVSSTDTASVVITSKPIKIDFLSGFLKARIKVGNPTDYTLENIRYEIEYTRTALAKADFSFLGYVTIPPGEHIITLGNVLGFGQTTLRITLGENIVKSEKIAIIGPFIFAYQ